MTDTNNTDGAALLPVMVEAVDMLAAEQFCKAHGWLCEDNWRDIHSNDRKIIAEAFARHRQAHSLPGDAETLALVAGYADYKAISDDRWEQGKAAGYRELGQLVAAALAHPAQATPSAVSGDAGEGE